MSLTAPANGATYTAPATVSLTATAADSDGTVSKVEFYQGATKLGEDTTSPYAYTWNSVAAGSYTLTAKAYDNSGAVTSSASVGITVNAAPGGNTVYLSDLTWTYVSNTWGPMEKDKSNGEAAAGDGLVITLNGVTYTKGLGTHAPSEVRYNLGGAYTTFLTDVGVDDEVGINGLVVFQVWADGTLLYDSGAMTGSTVTKSVDVSVAGKNELKLIVTDGGNGAVSDHADWAGARLLTGGAPANQPPTVSLTAPANGATHTMVPATVSLTATAADSDGTVAKVEFYQGATKLGEDTTSPYAYTWNSVAAGSYTLTAKAIDDDGATTTSAAVNVTVLDTSGFTVAIAGVATGGRYSLAWAVVNALPYIDRSYTISALSGTLNNGVLVRTAMDDKNVIAAAHLTLLMSQEARVYVCYDKRVTVLPSWLSDGTWTLVAETMTTMDGPASPMEVYVKTVPAGSLTLGGNHAGGGTGALSNYFLVIKPTAAVTPQFVEGPVAAAAWESAGDTDGDGLTDVFEEQQGLTAAARDTDGDGVPDEAELAGDGRVYWEVQEEELAMLAASAEGGKKKFCGATGMEAVLLALLIPLLRRRRR